MRFLPYTILKLTSLALFFFVLAASCKKEKKDEEACCKPVVQQTHPEPELINITANGFFVFRKYFTVTNHQALLDSVSSYAFEVVRGDDKISYQNVPYYGGNFLLIDTVKVNNIFFKRTAVPYSYDCKDTTHTNYFTPRVYKFYGDTSLFDNINYTDYTPIPDYTGVNFLQDSIDYRNSHSSVFIGPRNNVKEAVLFMTTPHCYIYAGYLESNQISFQFSVDPILTKYVKDQIKTEIILRNWVSQTINGRQYVFVTENMYFKN